VDGGHDDVAGRLAVQLDDVLVQVGLQGFDAVRLEPVVQAHLLRHHGLALHQAVRAPGLEQLQQFGQPEQVLGSDGGAQGAQPGPLGGVGELGDVLDCRAPALLLQGTAEVEQAGGVEVHFAHRCSGTGSGGEPC
jgi:hypothetical protein